jgi:GNAT superfamily N-acetyltransferase
MPNVVVRPLTSARWGDLETIFNARGCSVARGCWCMFYRKSGADATLPKGVTRAAANCNEHKALVDAGVTTGLIGYRGRQPVGWVSLGPRGDYAKLARSPVMKPVDETPVWSVVCFVVPAEHRGQGIAKALLDGAVTWAKRRGVRVLEAYPVDRTGRSRDDAMWFGARSMYAAAGFVEVARRKADRPVVRLTVR